MRSMQGRTLPQIGAVEINVIEEDVTRLLEFDRGRLDYVILRGEIASTTTLCLNANRFAVTADWQTSTSSGTARFNFSIEDSHSARGSASGSVSCSGWWPAKGSPPE